MELYQSRLLRQREAIQIGRSAVLVRQSLVNLTSPSEDFLMPKFVPPI